MYNYFYLLNFYTYCWSDTDAKKANIADNQSDYRCTSTKVRYVLTPSSVRSALATAAELQ